MNVIIKIDGREAIPVRAVPYVTGWIMSPDVVASSLAHTDKINRLEGITAYHYSSEDIAQMLPKEWDAAEADLETLSNKLKATETMEQENYPTWRREAIRMLLPGCFVWRAEFEAAFQDAYGPDRFSFLIERDGERELNFTPFIPLDLRAVVMEGFDDIAVVGKFAWPWGEYETPLLRILAGAVERWCISEAVYPSKKSSQVQEWIEAEMKKSGIPVSQALIDHIETIISPRVYSHTRQRVKSKE